MASGGYEIPFKDKLNCGMCKRMISDARSIACGHTFCKDCLNRSANLLGIVECCECKTKVKLSSGGADNLPRCFVINGFLDAIHETFGQGNSTDKKKEVTIGKHGFQLEENFSCAICLDLMTDPRYLPCGHSFCVACLMGLHQTQETPGIKCSHCKVERPLPPEGVRGLPIGHRIQSITTEIRLNKGEPPEPAGYTRVGSPYSSYHAYGQSGQTRTTNTQPPSAIIQIQVQDFNGKTHMVNLRRTDKVRDLRVKIEEKLKSTMSIASCQTLQFYMNFQGKCLDDKLTLSLESLGMQNLSHVFVQGRLLGGALCKHGSHQGFFTWRGHHVQI